jgi:hypothetical protein
MHARTSPVEPDLDDPSYCAVTQSKLMAGVGRRSAGIFDLRRARQSQLFISASQTPRRSPVGASVQVEDRELATVLAVRSTSLILPLPEYTEPGRLVTAAGGEPDCAR